VNDAVAAVLDADAARELREDLRIDGRALSKDDRAVAKGVRAEKGVGAQVGERGQIRRRCAADGDV
jgi:hypothetical protein